MTREKQPDIVYIQRDLQAIKCTLDKILRPYKNDVARLETNNRSLRESIRRKEKDTEEILRILAAVCPDALDSALSVLTDRTRRGWRTFRGGWRQRLGLTP